MLCIFLFIYLDLYFPSLIYYSIINYKRAGDKVNMEKVILNSSGGQINIASGNATINATQNNGVTSRELESIIAAIKENLSELDKENKEVLIDTIEMANDELIKSEPQKGRLRNCISLILPILSIANGIPVLANNIQRLIDYIMPYLQ